MIKTFCLKFIPPALGAFGIYLLLGALLPALRHKKGSAAVSPQDCCSDTEGTERIACVDDNTDALLWRLCLIENAQRQIEYSTFEFRDDTSGRDVMAALLDAAGRGVKVRIVIDAATAMFHFPASLFFKVLISHPNIEIRRYNPIHLLMPWKAQYRLHDKYLIADDTAYLLGGRNTDDRFLGDYGSKPNFDRELLVYQTEPALRNSLAQLRSYFDSLWDLSCCKRCRVPRRSARLAKAAEKLKNRYPELRTFYPEAYSEPDWAAVTVPANRITLLSNPNDAKSREPRLWASLISLMSAGSDIIIQTPYIICGKAMYRDLSAVCESAGNVKIIINAIENGANPFGCSDYMNHKKNVWNTGAAVYEFSGTQSAHTKALLIGRRLSVIGSFNMDMRSTYLDTELMLAVDCPALNLHLRENAAKYMAQSRCMRRNGKYAYGAEYTPGHFSLPRRVIYGLLRILSLPVRHLL